MLLRHFRRSLLVLSFLVPVLSSAQNKMYWGPATQVKWSDFAGPADAGSPYDAMTQCWFDYSYKYDRSGKMTITIKCSFLKDKSWKKANAKLTPYLLRHEQLHFDISEIFARVMRKNFATYVTTHTHNSNTDKEIKDIFDEAHKKSQAFHDRYDRETDHSKISAKQEEWDKKIQLMLAQLADYAV